MSTTTRLCFALVGVLAMASGCASAREGYLYDGHAPRKGSLTFQSYLSTRGRVDATLADGERCSGNFNTVPGVVEVDDETNRIDREDSQAGLAILDCGAKHVVRCGFQRDHSGAGYGHCSDTAGNSFDLYF